MPDSSGKLPGDPGYDAGSDSNNTDNGDGTYTDGQGNVMDGGGGLISPGPGSAPTADLSGGTNYDNGGGTQGGSLAGPGGSTSPVGNTPFPAAPVSGGGGGGGGSAPNPSPSPGPNPGPNPGPAPAPAPQPQNQNQNLLAGLDAQLQALLQALTSTNEEDFQEKVHEFNVTQANWLQQFNAQYGGLMPDGGQTLQAQQQAFEQAVQAAQLTGIYNGSPTLAAQLQQAQLSGMYNGQPTEAAREFNVNTQTDLAKLASSLSGPADYFKYLTAMNAGNNILSNLYTGQAQPAGGAPVGAIQPQSLGNILAGLGLGPAAAAGASGAPAGTSAAGIGLNPNAAAQKASYFGVAAPAQSALGGGGNMTAQSVGGGSPNTNTGTGVQLPYGMGQLPYMNQIQPTAYNSLSPSGQQFVQGAYAAAGYDPADLQRAILSETPAVGAAPSTSSNSTHFASPNSQSLFG